MSYSLPPSAPQAGTTSTVDTLDGRLTQGVSSLDPAHKDPVTNKALTAIWTQHTVDASGGGTGSEVRWYEIDPKNKVLFQSGIAQSPSLYVFNGAISSDRVVNGTTKKYGKSMGLGFNTSSASQSIAIQMVSKVGAGAQSGFVMVKQSPGKNVDFTCFAPYGPPCRWGDYAGASPDPAAPTGMGSGQVWFTNQWNVTSTDNTNIDWTTWNWGARL
jgi:hypothetical protein